MCELTHSPKDLLHVRSKWRIGSQYCIWVFYRHKNHSGKFSYWENRVWKFDQVWTPFLPPHFLAWLAIDLITERERGQRISRRDQRKAKRIRSAVSVVIEKCKRGKHSEALSTTFEFFIYELKVSKELCWQRVGQVAHHRRCMRRHVDQQINGAERS